jgi:CRP-like cAMP-binding protein
MRIDPGPDGTTTRLDELTVPRGRLLLQEGAVGSEAFIIAEGEATVFVDGQMVATLGPGDIIGEVSTLHDGPSAATVRAATELRLLIISGARSASRAKHLTITGHDLVQLARHLRHHDARNAELS